tara:strand:- start:1357 stop:2289 length:933 start_codon:yes stop_codon:yes gene_type:complete
MKTYSKSLIKEQYNRKNLSETWSEGPYDKYINSKSFWKILDFPLFNNKSDLFKMPDNLIDGSILEVGSAAGGAYNFLLSKKLINTKTDYTGIDISSKGISFCKKNYPNAKWIKQDLTNYKFKRNFDYSFERIAVHHMQNPLEIFNNILSVTNKSFSCCFVSCLNGKTISDLSISRYRHGKGDLVYFNIINLFEVIEIMIDNGFNNIHVLYHGEHEKVGNLPLAHQYLSPEINVKKRMIGRSTVCCFKTNEKSLNLILENRRKEKDLNLKIKKLFFLGDNSHRNFISKTLEIMKNRSYGILFKTNFKSDIW